MPFDIDFKKKAEIKLHIKKFLLYPPHWEDIGNHFPIPLTWNSCEFNEINQTIIPNQSGIYCFVVNPGIPNFFQTTYLFYAGKTNRTLFTRFGEYLNDEKGKGKPRPKVFEMLKMYKGHLHFYFAEIPLKANVDICEEKLLNMFIPHVNTSIPVAIIKPELKNIYE